MPAILQRTACVMSTDKENNKIEDMKVEEKEKEEVKKVEANDVDKKESKDVKVDEKEEKEEEAGGDSEPEKEKVDKKKGAAKPKETKKKKEVVKSEEEEEEEDEQDEGSEEAEEEEEPEKPKKEKGVPLLDQPLHVSGPRQRKGVERLSVAASEPKDQGPIEIPEGKGVSLGSISVVEYNISRIKGDDLKKFHQLLFGRIAKPTFIKKNIRKFNGFDFEADSEQYEKKKAAFLKLDTSALRDMASLLNLTKSGSKEEVGGRLMDFLMEPVAPAAKKGSAGGSAGVTKGGRPKRTAAVRADTKGYSESDDEEDVKRGPRSRRAKGKRVSLKDESSSEDDGAKAGTDDEKASEASVEEPASSDESDDGEKKKKRVPVKAAPVKKAAPPAKKPAAKKPEKKAAAKRKPASEEEEEDESSSDDVPLSKKVKAPPTDEEIKTYVKQILEGANLEEITMKTVCKQVYSHYPDFDLAHKKDFIKTTVKSLIST